MARFRATPYAKALHEVILADEPSRVEAVVDELESVAVAVESVPTFLTAMVTPMVSTETKAAILEQVLDALEITQPVRRFIAVVQQHYRLEHMRSIVDVYRDLVDRSLGRTRATVEVAAQLADDQRRKILDLLAEVVGTDVIADFVNTPELLAGFRVQVGSKVFDGSLVGQLKKLSGQTQIEQG